MSEDRKICPCCRGALHRMGGEVSKQLHIEVTALVLQHARFKCACRHCERYGIGTPIVTAPMPVQPLLGSHASASVIATVTAGKFVDGTPLYRMEDVLGRANIQIGRGTLANGIIRPAELHYCRLADALRKTLLSEPLIHGDETTTVQVLKEPGKTAKASLLCGCTATPKSARLRWCCLTTSQAAARNIRRRCLPAMTAC